MAVLKILSGRKRGKLLHLEPGQTLFGRNPNCQVVLSDSAVSRHHAQVVVSDEGSFVEDLKSQNGTLLNGDKIEARSELYNCDEISICGYLFGFYFDTPDDSTDSYPKPDSNAAGDSGNGFVVGEGVVQEQGLRGTKELPLHPQDVEIADEVLLEASDPSGSDLSAIIARRDSSDSHVSDAKPEAVLDAVLRISNNLRRVLDLDGVMNEVLDGLFGIFLDADDAFVMLREEEPDKLVVRATRTRDANSNGRVPISMTIIRAAMETGDALLSEDVIADTRFEGSASIGKLNVRSILCVPLIGKAGDTIGIIQLATSQSGYKFREEDLDVLTSIAMQGSLAIENARLHQESLKQSQLTRELEFATQVQRGFLPSAAPVLDGYEFGHHYQSANNVGGDYFDYVGLPGGRIAMSLADVAGKGVPAALLMAKFYSSARYHLLTNDNLAGAMAGLNKECCETSGLGHRFISCLMVVIDPENHTATISNAGHLPPIRCFSKDQSELVGVRESVMPLGILAEQEFCEVVVPIDPGDTLLLYTDGITEAQDDNNEMYSSVRLREVVSNSTSGVTELIGEIIADVDSFMGNIASADDVCLMACRRS